MCNFNLSTTVNFGATTTLARQCLGVLTCLTLVCSEPLLAQTNAPASPFPPNRYLIVVETSRAMRTRLEGTSTLIQTLIGSGMNGQMHPGDTIGVWTYNDSLYRGKLPLQEWYPDQSDAVTSRIRSFIQSQPYEKHSRLDDVTKAVMHLIKSSEFVTVMLISDGSAEIHGTPYDSAINGSFKHWNAQQLQGKVPFLTVLRGNHGVLTAGSVTPAPWPVDLPPLPRELTVAKSTPKRAPAVKASPAPIVPSLIVTGKKPQPATALIQTEPRTSVPGASSSAPQPADTSSQSKTAHSDSAPGAPSPGQPIPPISSSNPSPVPGPNTAETALVPTQILPPTVAAEEKVALPQDAPNVALAGTTVISPAPAQQPITLAQTELQREASKPRASIDQPPASTPAVNEPVPPLTEAGERFPWPINSTGIVLGALICCVATGAFVWTRSRRSTPAAHVSLITRSIERESH